jgi:hypothetical protein
MPLFPWDIAFHVFATVMQEALDLQDEELRGGTAGRIRYLMREEMAIAALRAQQGEGDRSEEAELARSRWLEEHRAERTFPCGVVPDPVLEATQSTPPEARPARELLPSDPGWAAPDLPATTEAAVPPDPHPSTPLRPMQLLAAVLPTDLVFIREYGEDEEVQEVGRLPRRAIQGTDVVDSAGAHVPEPVEETIEPSTLAWTVLRWSNQGAPDEDRFAFRSSWTAWRAARHLLAAKQG